MSRNRQKDLDLTIDIDSADAARRSLEAVGDKLKSKKLSQKSNNEVFNEENNSNQSSPPLESKLPRLAKRMIQSTTPVIDNSNPTGNLKDLEVKGDEIKRKDLLLDQRPSLILEESPGLGQLEHLRVVDIETDANSAASQAFDALKNVNRSSLSFTNNNSPKEAGGSVKKVEGREIRQNHELYGMTYGMMLGIRVLTGRRELYDCGSNKKSKRAGQRELTEEDYDYELELNFPPEGTSGNVDNQIDGLYATPPHKLKSSFKFKDYMANAFHAVRSQSNIDEAEYMLSIAGDFNYIEFIANSKSGQFFFYSYDGKYMIKTQTKEESKLLRRIFPQYVAHLAKYPKSLLVRFYGMHRVKMSSISNKPIYFVVMSSVFNSELPIHVKYDIKGSLIGRLTKPDACKVGAVQKDLNLIESGRVLRIGRGLVDVFLEVLSADAMFLRSMRIMDYSLLIGIHEIGSTQAGRRMSGVVPSIRKSSPLLSSPLNISTRSRRLSFMSKGDRMFNSYYGGILAAPHPRTGNRDEVYFFGIIDILQLYNTSKRVETIFKGITNKVKELSSVDPDFYAMRFISFVTDRTDYALYRPKTSEIKYDSGTRSQSFNEEFTDEQKTSLRSLDSRSKSSPRSTAFSSLRNQSSNRAFDDNKDANSKSPRVSNSQSQSPRVMSKVPSNDTTSRSKIPISNSRQPSSRQANVNTDQREAIDTVSRTQSRNGSLRRVATQDSPRRRIPETSPKITSPRGLMPIDYDKQGDDHDNNNGSKRAVTHPTNVALRSSRITSSQGRGSMRNQLTGRSSFS